MIANTNPKVPRRPNSGSRRARIQAIVMAAGLVGVALTPASAMGTAASAMAETPVVSGVVNGDFTEGLDGWKTNNPSAQTLTKGSGRSGGGVELTTSQGPGHVILNDEIGTVKESTAGHEYVARAWVKTATPNVSGALRLREVAGSAVSNHQINFTLSDTGWKSVTLNFRTSLSKAKFDLNVLGYSLSADENLIVDDVSLVRVLQDEVDPEPRPTVGGFLTQGGTYSEMGIPSRGAFFGAAVGGNSDPSVFEKQLGSRLGIRRTFYNGGEVTSAVNTAKMDIANGRVPWISFKLPYSWRDMADGRGDAWAKDLTIRLSKLDGPVWIAFHHEPEGDGNISDWTSMQKHLSPIVHNNSDNVAVSMIVTGWHQIYGAQQYSLDNIWPGEGVVDIMGFDIYNYHGVVKRGKELEPTDLDSSYFTEIQDFAVKHDVKWGLAETGFNDIAAKEDPEWLQRTYADLTNRGGIGMAYFNTELNSISSWLISGQQKTSLFSSVLENSTKMQ